jgi:hypothetical protein
LVTTLCDTAAELVASSASKLRLLLATEFPTMAGGLPFAAMAYAATDAGLRKLAYVGEREKRRRRKRATGRGEDRDDDDDDDDDDLGGMATSLLVVGICPARWDGDGCVFVT